MYLSKKQISEHPNLTFCAKKTITVITGTTVTFKTAILMQVDTFEHREEETGENSNLSCVYTIGVRITKILITLVLVPTIGAFITS